MNTENLYYCILGLGMTGLSVAKFCARENIPFGITDTRTDPPGFSELTALGLQGDIACGGFSESLIQRATHLIVSPGISLKSPLIEQAKAQGKTVIGDIELFARLAKRPILGITGSNGKTTVTTLLGEMAGACHRRAVIAGNIGYSVLDSLATKRLPDLYILELSSFQLESTYSLHLKVATVLNLCEDHMDRYDSLAEYAAAKQRIYEGAEVLVYNRQDPFSVPPACGDKISISFGLDAPDGDNYGVCEHFGRRFLVKGQKRLLDTSKLPLEGDHHLANALASLALGEAAGFEPGPMLEVLKHFHGIAHRCQWISTLHGVHWFNDSKGTNVGATIAALKTVAMKTSGKIILIAGGQGKGADFSLLKPSVKQFVRHLIVMGESADLLHTIMASVVSVSVVKSMAEAVTAADLVALRGDSVLLSPACASFDMFTGYVHRGEVFEACVKAL